MKKLILILLAFIALFTFIRAFEVAEASELNSGEINTAEVSSAEISTAEISIEIPVEIVR